MISEFHLRAWNRLPQVEIVGLCDRAVSRAEQRRAEFVPGARVYSDLDAMLAAERPDFIDILTPPQLHEAHCQAAIAAGVHIICQKPLCASIEAARRLAAQANDYQKILAIHENHPYRPWFQRLRVMHKDGRLGRVSRLHLGHLDATEPREQYKRDAPTGVWLEYGSHLVDMMRKLLGEPSRVYARMHRANASVRGESIAHAVFEYPDATAVIDAGWKHGGMTQAAVEIAGDRGEAWYEGTLTRGESARFRVVRDGHIEIDDTLSPYDEYLESFYLFERECVQAMLGQGRIEQTVDEQLKTLACVFAAYEAAERGSVVTIG